MCRCVYTAQEEFLLQKTDISFFSIPLSPNVNNKIIIILLTDEQEIKSLTCVYIMYLTVGTQVRPEAAWPPFYLLMISLFPGGD